MANQPLKRYDTGVSSWVGVAAGSVSDGTMEYGVDQLGFSSISRQAIINGNFDIWQRGTSFSNPTPAGAPYLADRWRASGFSDGGSFPSSIIHSRLTLTSVDIPGATYGYRVTVNGAGSGYGINAYDLIDQPIENGTRLLCGIGKKVTVSFWARSSIAGKRIAVNIAQEYGSGGSPSTSEQLVGSVITLSSTLTKYTVIFNTNTLVGKSFGSNNDDVLRLRFWNVWSSAFYGRFGATTDETYRASGTIDIAQVQINAGDVVLPFQQRSLADELALCQRYFEKSYNLTVFPGTITDVGSSFFVGTSYGYAGSSVPFRVRKRLTPTVIVYSPSTGSTGKLKLDTGSEISGGAGFVAETSFKLEVSGVSTNGNMVWGQWAADAEL